MMWSRRRRKAAIRFSQRYGPWALVLGASEGIGAAFAEELARRGLSVILVARQKDKLNALSSRLVAHYRAPFPVVVCDLEAEDAAERIFEAATGHEVGLLVYNAATSSVGRFLDVDPGRHLRAIDVNARSLVASVHRFARPMRERGRGGIVVMSSLTAFQGTPLVATYGATKAFGLAFAEALGDELSENGIDVLACCAGATATPGYARVTREGSAGRLAPAVQEPAEVAREALEALGRRSFVITGRGNRFVSFLMRRFLSRRRSVRWIGKEMRRRYEG